MKFIQTELKKMNVQLKNGLVHYFLKVENKSICVNEWINKTIKLNFLNQINCLACRSSIKKSYNQGYCYLCFTRLPVNDLCIVKPELCHHHLGTCRDSNWGSEYCFSPHLLYLSLTSEPKVGITKYSHYLNRWIDQGATKAVKIAKVTSRYQSGLLEKFLKDNHFSDRTNWRVLLKENSELNEESLISYKEKMIKLIQDYCRKSEQIDINSIEFYPDEVSYITYPGKLYQQKSVCSINLDKNPEYQGKLIGIKGQYFIFEDAVINLRKYGGYHVSFEITS